MAGGRPTKYTPQLLKKANDYLDGGWKQTDSVIPSHVGLALELDITTETLYVWAKEEGKKQFSDILAKILQKQQNTLISKGLSGDFNSNITKLVLGKHGFHDKVTQEQVGEGGGPVKTVNEWVITTRKAKEPEGK